MKRAERRDGACFGSASGVSWCTYFSYKVWGAEGVAAMPVLWFCKRFLTNNVNSTLWICHLYLYLWRLCFLWLYRKRNHTCYGTPRSLWVLACTSWSLSCVASADQLFKMVKPLATCLSIICLAHVGATSFKSKNNLVRRDFLAFICGHVRLRTCATLELHWRQKWRIQSYPITIRNFCLAQAASLCSCLCWTRVKVAGAFR